MDLWVKFNEEVTFLGEFIVAFHDLLTNVLRDLLTNFRVDDVDDPLPREAVKIALIRQALPNLRFVLDFFQEFLDGQTWVERSVEMF